jgi:hypothetical protein
MLKLTLGIAVAVLAVSCASSGTPRTDATTQQTRRSRDVITQAEIDSSSAGDAYQAIQLLRPEWLRSRGAGSMSGAPSMPVAYVDGQSYGAVQSLQTFRAGSVKELRFYSASEATNRWGTGHSGGVIYLTTRSGR